MTKEEVAVAYAQEFWKLTNVITGFCIVQSLAIYIALGPHKGDFYDAVIRNKAWVSGGTIIGTGCYLCAITFCRYAQLALLAKVGVTPDPPGIFLIWYVVQLIVVGLLGLFSFVVWR
jgi:hypothetical protein